MKERTIYLIKAGDLYKIGYTKRKVSERIKDFKTGNSSEFEIIKEFKCDKNWSKVEKAVHRTYNEKLIDGEWFNLSKEDVDNFIETCKKYKKSFDFLSQTNPYI